MRCEIRAGYGGVVVALMMSLTVLGGCLSVPSISDAPGDRAVVIDAVPATQWSDNSCAAGALSEVLTGIGDYVTEEELNGHLTRARLNGVVSVDLLLAARRRGHDARIIAGTRNDLRRALSDLQPMILMLRVVNAPGVDDDLFHYVVLSGYDPETDAVRMHIGNGERRWVPIAVFLDDWAAAGKAAILVSPKSARVSNEDDLRRAVFLESEEKLEEAIELYESYLASNPSSVVGWTNLGNAHARAGNARVAEIAYRNALHLDPAGRDASNNLAWLLLGQDRLDEAEDLARRAVELEGPDQHLIEETLASILEAQGRCDEAAAIRSESGTTSGAEARGPCQP